LLEEVTLAYVRDQAGIPENKTLHLLLAGTDDNTILAAASITADFIPTDDPRGDEFTFEFPQAVKIEAGQSYAINLMMADTLAELVISGSAPANESSWDDGLPLRMDGYDGYGGIYKKELNLELYWDDNIENLYLVESTVGDYYPSAGTLPAYHCLLSQFDRLPGR
jgi:hypothetical protein